MSFIEDRLSELEQEKDELKEYEHLDKRRRALEYSLFDKELRKANDQLREIENSRDYERQNQLSLHNSLRKIQDDLQVEEDALATAKVLYCIDKCFIC